MTTALRTQDDVFKLRAPPTGEKAYFDKGKDRDRVAGLALRVRAAGSRRWCFYYRFNGRQSKLVIGDASAIDLAVARKKARECLVKVHDRVDPAIEVEAKRDAAELTFSKVLAQYLDIRKDNMRPRSFEATKQHLEEH